MYAEQRHGDDVRRMTEAEYLAFADGQELKYEYSQGRVYAMSGGSVRHGIITANAIAHLINILADRDCTVISPDVRVAVMNKQAYRYPDVTVFCGEPAYLEGRTDTIINPVLLVEVLSPATAVTDYNEKLEEYTQIESLQAYILIAQNVPKVETFQRYRGDQWLYQYATGLTEEIEVAALDGSWRLSLAQIYRRVRWDDAETSDPT
jgi:Uma2 family endonuclease